MKELRLLRTKKCYKTNKIIFRNFKIATEEETIENMCKGMSICRYGDGEFDLVMGKSIGFQKWNPKIANRLKEILINNDSNVMVAIPKIFKRDFTNYNDRARDFWEGYYRENFIKISKNINRDKYYYSSQVTRFYIDAEDKSICDERIKSLKKIWDNKDVLIVEGYQTRMGIGNDLLDKAKSIKRILCPAENAFDKYEEILNNCLKFQKDCLILIALGPTATVLAYDLGNKGYHALDIGHIDIEYEWYLKGDTHMDKPLPVEGKFTNEAVGGHDVGECHCSHCNTNPT